MINRGNSNCYLLTDGEPNSYGSEEDDREREIRDITNLLVNRPNPITTPFTFLCCSGNPEDTLWMHEIEEIACRQNRFSYIAALQNFYSERREVLNDQGETFPYNRGLWLMAGLLASKNPNDLDALDQHAPLTKRTIEELIGRTLTEQEYRSYFDTHPNAVWLFAEDYNAFLSQDIARNIPSVAFFDSTLGDQLQKDINNNDDTSEPRAINYTEEAVLIQFGRRRPPELIQSRRNFWLSNARRMEQLQSLNAQNPLWSTYLYQTNQTNIWMNYQSTFTPQSQFQNITYTGDIGMARTPLLDTINRRTNWTLPQRQVGICDNCCSVQ
jgi:hypothetical protein